MNRGRVLLSITGMSPHRWFELLSREREVVLDPDGPNDPSIRYAVVWHQKRNVLSGLPNLKAVFSVGAGVDHVLSDSSLPDVPIVRIIDPNLTQHMVEYVVWRVLDHHRQGAIYNEQKRRKVWHERSQRTAGDVSVGIMGIGALGSAAARALVSLGFNVNGWSRTQRALDGVSTWHGEDGLVPFLNATDILVVLLPLTERTRGVIGYGLLRQLRRRNALGGAVLISAGRGRLHKEADILRALEDGTLKEASLDVFEQEPLPRTSPFWTNPKVFITPHAAATSDPDSLVGPMLEQMRAHDEGKPLRNLVDRSAGY